MALPTMIRFHGSLNALGFVGLGLLGMCWLAPTARALLDKASPARPSPA